VSVAEQIVRHVFAAAAIVVLAIVCGNLVAWGEGIATTLREILAELRRRKP